MGKGKMEINGQELGDGEQHTWFFAGYQYFPIFLNFFPTETRECVVRLKPSQCTLFERKEEKPNPKRERRRLACASEMQRVE